jgi:hypothetical protein
LIDRGFFLRSPAMKAPAADAGARGGRPKNIPQISVRTVGGDQPIAGVAMAARAGDVVRAASESITLENGGQEVRGPAMKPPIDAASAVSPFPK